VRCVVSHVPDVVRPFGDVSRELSVCREFFDFGLQHAGCGRIDFLKSDIERFAIHSSCGFLVAYDREIALGLQINALNVWRQVFWDKWAFYLRPKLLYRPIQLRYVTRMAAPTTHTNLAVTHHNSAARLVALGAIEVDCAPVRIKGEDRCYSQPDMSRSTVRAFVGDYGHNRSSILRSRTRPAPRRSMLWKFAQFSNTDDQ